MTAIRITGLGLAIVLLGLPGPGCAPKKTTKIIPEKTTGVRKKDAGGRYVLWCSVNQGRDTLKKVPDPPLPSRFEILVNGKRVFERGLCGTHIGTVEKDVTEFITDPDKISIAFRVCHREAVNEQVVNRVSIYLLRLTRRTKEGKEEILLNVRDLDTSFQVPEDLGWLHRVSGIDLKGLGESAVGYKEKEGHWFVKVGPAWNYKSRETRGGRYQHAVMGNRIVFGIPKGSFGKGDYAQLTWRRRSEPDPFISQWRGKIPEPTTESRVGWINLGDGAFPLDKEKGPEGIRMLLDEAVRGGLNGVTVFHRGVETITNWDPIKVLIQEGHKRGMSVGVVLIVMANRSTVAKHPHWRRINQSGEKSGWLCPSNPEVRKHLCDLTRNIAEKYDFDWLDLDYARAKLCYCDHCRKAFQKVSGVDPINLGYENDAWVNWTTANVTAIVRDIRKTLREVKPDAMMSAYIGVRTPMSLTLRGAHQNWPEWIRKGHIDFLEHGGYCYDLTGKADPEVFRKTIRQVKTMTEEAARKRGKPCPLEFVIGIDTSHGRLATAREIAEYIEVAREEGISGISFFKLIELLPHLPLLHKTVFTKPAQLPPHLQIKKQTQKKNQ